jgi:hypothetical protein
MQGINRRTALVSAAVALGGLVPGTRAAIAQQALKASFDASKNERFRTSPGDRGQKFRTAFLVRQPLIQLQQPGAGRQELTFRMPLCDSACQPRIVGGMRLRVSLQPL